MVIQIGRSSPAEEKFLILKNHPDKIKTLKLTGSLSAGFRKKIPAQPILNILLQTSGDIITTVSHKGSFHQKQHTHWEDEQQQKNKTRKKEVVAQWSGQIPRQSGEHIPCLGQYESSWRKNPCPACCANDRLTHQPHWFADQRHSHRPFQEWRF